MNLTPQQKAAIDSDARDILLSAGAGSGKTSTTVRRYERLLTGNYTDGREGDPVEPSSILVFTFTEKAAGELRERIRKLRDDGSLEFSMGSLWIGTFHSICARILRGHPIAAAVDPSFEVIDDVVANRLKEAAYVTALDKTCEEGDSVGILAPFSQFNLKKGIQSTYERLRAAGEFKPVLPPAPEGRAPEVIQRELLREALSVQARDDLPANPKKKAGNIVAALRDLDPEDLTFEVLDSIDFFKNSSVIPELCANLKSAKTELQSKVLGPPVWEVLGSLLNNYGDAYEQAKTRRGGLDFEDLQLKTLDLLLRRPDVAGTYRDQFAEIMVDEFQDTNRLQMDLIDKLRGESTRLFTVGDEMQAIYGFRYADVELFRQRRAGISFHLPEDKERRQAGERDRREFEIDALSLSANFRSQAPVIGAVNEIGRQMESLIEGMRTEGDPGGEIGGTRHEFEELRVGLVPVPADGDTGDEADWTREAAGVEILLTEAEAWQQVNLGPLAPQPGEHQYVTKNRGQHEAEALVLAWHIRGAIEDGMKPSEIVVLFRTKTRMWLFEAALRQVGLNPYVVGGTGFWETREGVDLRALLATVANPMDDESLAGTLAGPACGLSPSALWLLARGHQDDCSLWTRLVLLADHGIGGIDQSDRDLATGFVATIRSLQTRRAGLSLAETVKAAVSGTGYDLVSAIRDPSGAGLANIRRVAEIAGEYEAAEGRDLRGLVSWIEDSFRLDSEQAIATEDEDSDVIRLMTIHKSKGLEFPMVCVADLGRLSKANSESVIWVSPRVDEPGRFEAGLRLPVPESDDLDLFDWTRLKDRNRLETTDEELRILHVALTRAQRRLVLSGVADLEKIPGLTESRSTATRLTQAFGIDGIEDGIEIPAPEPPVGLEFEFPESRIEVTVVRAEDAEGLGRVLDAEHGRVPVKGDGKPPLGRPGGSAFPEVPLSYSALASYRECPARFFATRVLKLDPPDGTKLSYIPEDQDDTTLDPAMAHRQAVDPTAFGVAVHELLELPPRRRWLMPGDDEIREVLSKHGVETAPEVKAAREMIEGFLGSDLGQKVRQSQVDVETGLLIEIDGVIIRGFADLLVRDPELPVILDYKSNQIEGTSISGLMEKYDLQRDLYALAVSLALETDRVETAFVFLRYPAAPVRDLFDADRLAKARESVSGLVGDIAKGHYLGGPEARHQPCGKCWACELLAGQIEAAGGVEAN